MNFIEFNSFSNAWFWFSMITVWAVFSQLYYGISYNQLRLARRQHPERQEALLQALALYFERVGWRVSLKSGSLAAGVVAFLLSFWAVSAFYYAIEILQALFILAVPMIPCLILRWRLANKLAQKMPDFETVFLQVRKIRRWTLCWSFLTILLSTIWGIRMIIRDYPI